MIHAQGVLILSEAISGSLAAGQQFDRQTDWGVRRRALGEADGRGQSGAEAEKSTMMFDQWS